MVLNSKCNCTFLTSLLLALIMQHLPNRVAVLSVLFTEKKKRQEEVVVGCCNSKGGPNELEGIPYPCRRSQLKGREGVHIAWTNDTAIIGGDCNSVLNKIGQISMEIETVVNRVKVRPFLNKLFCELIMYCYVLHGLAIIYFTFTLCRLEVAWCRKTEQQLSRRCW